MTFEVVAGLVASASFLVFLVALVCIIKYEVRVEFERGVSAVLKELRAGASVGNERVQVPPALLERQARVHEATSAEPESPSEEDDLTAMMPK